MAGSSRIVLCEKRIEYPATMSINDIKADLKALVAEKNCGPLMIRLSWHDAGKWSSGKLTGGKCFFLCCGDKWILKDTTTRNVAAQ